MNTFDYLVYAIVAISLILVFFFVWDRFVVNKDPTIVIREGLTIAQTSSYLGKTLPLAQLRFDKDKLLTTSDFASTDLLVAFECTDPALCCIRESDNNKKTPCDKPFTWDYNYIKSKIIRHTFASIRCVKHAALPACKIYVGPLPAQAKIVSLENAGESNNTTTIKVTVTNSGANDLAFGTNSLALYRKAGDDWVITNYLTDVKEVERIAPKELHVFYWGITPANLGDYQATFTFEGSNAGYDTNAIVFTKTTNSLCETLAQNTDTIFNPTTNKYDSVATCTGCNYAYECANAWHAKTSIVYNPLNKDQATCEKNTYEGTC